MLRRRNCCRPPVVTPHTRASQGRRLSDVAVAILAVARELVEVEGGPSRSSVSSLSRFGHDLARVLRCLFSIDFDPPRCVQLAVGPRARPGPPTPGEGRATWIARTGRALAARARRQPRVNTCLLQR